MPSRELQAACWEEGVRGGQPCEPAGVLGRELLITDAMAVSLVTFGYAVPLRFAGSYKCERGNDTCRFGILVSPGCNFIQQGGGVPLAPGILACGFKQPPLEQERGGCFSKSCAVLSVQKMKQIKLNLLTNGGKNPYVIAPVQVSHLCSQSSVPLVWYGLQSQT